jgi:hypothetical protein
MTTKNFELLHRVYNHIEAHPGDWEQWDYATWRPCGAAYCFAGHTVMIEHPFATPVWDEGDIGTTCVRLGALLHDIPDLAMDALGLTGEEADELFEPRNTLEEIRDMVAKWEAEETSAKRIPALIGRG